MEHISVLLNESIDMLQIKEDGIYVDCTLGRGGHSSEILKRLTSGHLYAFDCDQNAIDESTPRLQAIGDNFTLNLPSVVLISLMESLWIWVYRVHNLMMAKGGLAIVRMRV